MVKNEYQIIMQGRHYTRNVKTSVAVDFGRNIHKD